MSGLAKTTESEQPPAEVAWHEEVPASVEPASPDDVPTIISSKRMSPASAEEVLRGTLKGHRLAHFELIAPIGVGGMAAVIKARDTQLDRMVALKILPPESSADPESIQRFHYEARAAAKLDHENVARVFFCGEDRGLHFIAFEFVEGQNLRSMLEKRGRLPVTEALHYLLQLAAGLAHAAGRGVVHRDIKPSNVIITPHGRAKLVDMGLARSMTPQDDLGLTRSGVTLGTFDYVSPEQALEPREADVRSDIYSLGCTFYHLLTGQPPVPDGTAAKKLHHHQQVPPIDPRELNPGIPMEVAWILSRMMAKDPRDRYQRPEELVKELLNVTHQLEGAADDHEKIYYVDVPVAPSFSLRPMVVGALALVMVITLVLALGRFVPSAGPSFSTNAATGVPGAGSDPIEDAVLNGGKKSDSTHSGDGRPPGAVGKPKTVELGPSELLALVTDKARELPTDAAIKITLDRDLDLRDLDSVVLHGREIVIRAAPGLRRRPTIYLSRRPASGIALLLQADRVRLEEIRFQHEIDVALFSELRQDAVGVLIEGGDQHEIVHCRFLQLSATIPTEHVACSLKLAGGAQLDDARSIKIHQCAFLGGSGLSKDNQLQEAGRGGHVAVWRQSPIELVVSECPIGPHRQCFRLEDRLGARTRLQDSTIMLGDRSCVLHLAPQTNPYELQLEKCVIARLSPPDVVGALARPSDAALIEQVGGDSDSFQLHEGCLGNVLCQVDRFCNKDKTWEDWHKRELGGASPVAELYRRPFRHASVLPWKSMTPAADLQQLQIASAFRLNGAIADLRQTPNSDALVGLTEWDGVPLNLRSTPEGGKPAVATKREAIIDPKGERGPNRFHTIVSALSETAEEKEVVLLIHHTGVMHVNPIPKYLTHGRKITIRPGVGHKPTLALQTDDPQATLFELSRGSLHLEGLYLELRPGASTGQEQTVVVLHGQGACTLKRCWVTLYRPDGTTLAVAALKDGAAVSGSEVADDKPKLVIENCFVRGQGDLIWCRNQRSFDFQLRSSLAVLNGSLLVVHEEKGNPPLRMEMKKKEIPEGNVVLQNVTAYLSRHLCHLHVADLKTMRPLRSKVTRCLFAARTDQPLIKLEGPQGIDKKMLNTALPWEGDQNLYSNFPIVLDRRHDVDAMPSNQAPLELKDWQLIMIETESSKEKVTFKHPPDNDEDFAKAVPADFASSIEDRGAHLSDVPVPASPKAPPLLPLP